MAHPHNKPYTMYTLPVTSLRLHLGGAATLDITNLLESGRANYQIVQHLVATCAGLEPGSEGGSADLLSTSGETYEVKAYRDHHTYPESSKKNLHIHTAASSTFPANNNGPLIKSLLEGGNYPGALAVCEKTGYSKNKYYIYTNTRSWRRGTPLRYLIIPTEQVLRRLDTGDPRIINRSTLLGLVTSEVTINPHQLPV